MKALGLASVVAGVVTISSIAPAYAANFEIDTAVQRVDESCMRNKVAGVQLGDNISSVKSNFSKVVSDRVGKYAPGFGKLVAEEGSRRWYIEYDPAGTIYNVGYEAHIPFQEIAAVKEQLCDRYVLSEQGCATPVNIPKDRRDHIWGASNRLRGKIRACLIEAKLSPLKIKTVQQTMTGQKTIRSLNTEEAFLFIRVGKDLSRVNEEWETKKPKVAQRDEAAQRSASKEYF